MSFLFVCLFCCCCCFFQYNFFWYTISCLFEIKIEEVLSTRMSAPPIFLIALPPVKFLATPLVIGHGDSDRHGYKAWL